MIRGPVSHAAFTAWVARLVYRERPGFHKIFKF